METEQNSNNLITTSSLLPMVRNTSLLPGKTFVGIDFGTTTTVVSIATYDTNTNKIQTKALELKQRFQDNSIYIDHIVPSVIAWSDAFGILIGQGAAQLKYKFKRGKNIWYSFKMELGEDLGVKYYESELKDDERFNLQNPSDAVKIFFGYLNFSIIKYCEENHLSKDILYAVSIPASFEANQRKDLYDALVINNMEVSKQSFIDEPNAAFISYIIEKDNENQPLFLNPNYNSKVLVFDFGGGTCDISLLEIGQNSNGFFSKNIGISKFTQLGGDDIDRYIVYHYLMPRFFEKNNVKKQDFRTKEKEHIANVLRPIAEMLKIEKCKSLTHLMRDFKLPQIIHEDVKTEKNIPIKISTSKGTLSQDQFYLTNKELTKALDIFTKDKFSTVTRVDGEDDYYSIFRPIKDIISKTHTPKGEIDYVLLIGGSSECPHIQEALHNYFKDSELLVPRDLRTHVSQGTAIHSLLLNGMNKSLIQPITSESIFAIIKNEELFPLIPAGTQIPCSPIAMDQLVSSYDGQQTIEIPLCVGNKDKILFNLKITSNSSDGFPQNTPIHLIFDINTDKMLNVHAKCLDIICHTEPLNPYTNKELSSNDRAIVKAERDYNLNVARNNGVPTLSALNNLVDLYRKFESLLKLAETYELQSELYPSSTNKNTLGVYYHNCGLTDKALEYYSQALEQEPNNPTYNFNYGHTMKYKDKEIYKKYVKKACDLDPSYGIALYELGKIENSEGNKEKAIQMFRKAYNILMDEWGGRDNFSKCSLGWLKSVAEELNEDETVEKIEKLLSKKTVNIYYNEKNLSSRKENLPIEK